VNDYEPFDRYDALAILIGLGVLILFVLIVFNLGG